MNFNCAPTLAIEYFTSVCSVERYESQFPWLRDRKFLHELESDSVDTEILEEELLASAEDETSYTYVRKHGAHLLLVVVL